MAQASWNGSPGTIPAFINNLFSTSVRSPAGVQSAVNSGALTYSFTDDATRGLILNAWLAAWQNANSNPCDPAALARCPATDQTLISILSGYIKANTPIMSVPTLTYASPQPANTKYAVYSNSGYVGQPFMNGSSWNYGEVSSSGQPSGGAVANFLFLLFHGAHFVLINNYRDLKIPVGPPQFWSSFGRSAQVSGDLFNSHYAGLNFSGFYYLNITDDELPANNPLLLAFLAGLTNPAQVEYILSGLTPPSTEPVTLPPKNVLLDDARNRRALSNTFIQLEGWQNHAPYFWDNHRHGADYDAHDATKWNISTFGASAYSEKRSTPIFLAQSTFSTAIDATTHMPLYDGATTKEFWMNPGLLQTGT